MRFATILLILTGLSLTGHLCLAASSELPDSYNVVWTKQSQNSSESMPVGGGDVGLNVWVENGELLFYIGKDAAFDENNQLLKLGRVRVRMAPNPFEPKASFRQVLKLRQGYVEIVGINPNVVTGRLKLWVEVFRPVVHLEIAADRPVAIEAFYESWRTKDRLLPNQQKRSRFAAFGTEGYPGEVYTRKDTIGFRGDTVEWYHRNSSPTQFDIEVEQQGLARAKHRMWDPLKNRTFGGRMVGQDMVAAGTVTGTYIKTPYRAWRLRSRTPQTEQHLKVFLHTEQAETLEQWKEGLDRLARAEVPADNVAWQRNLDWWDAFWRKSYLMINADRPDPDDKGWQVARNYQLFRYMLGCTAYGEYPTKFNGSLFTFDPQFIDLGGPSWHVTSDETPDYRMWGGGSYTAQNQRLVYYPMLKTGDFDLMLPQFEFYRRALPNAEQRVKISWGHAGCSFTEQMNQYGLPIGSHYGWIDAKGYRQRPADLEQGVQVNSAVGYLYDSQLEFSWMILLYHRFTGNDISAYVPFMESAVTFYDKHYQMRHRQRSGHPLDNNGHLVIEPSNACEGYKGSKNPTAVVTGLKMVLSGLIELPDEWVAPDKKRYFREVLKRVPPMPTAVVNGHRIIEPATGWRHHHAHSTEMYPLYPYQIFGLGLPDFELIRGTWLYGVPEAHRFSYRAWPQGNIHYARLGFTREAAELAIKKLGDSPDYRFPAFWLSGDTPPDFNQGGSGMIGLQEMLMQTHGGKIRLLPAWPTEWDCDFRLHAPGRTVVEGRVRSGKLEQLVVTPPSRRDDVIVMETKDAGVD